MRVLCNGVWDMYHVGHANAWLQAKLNTGAPGQEVSIVVALHDSESVHEAKGRPTVYDDAERAMIAAGCKWVEETVPHVPYDVITEELMDTHGCAWVSHGDDMIILPGRPHMYSEADAANRFRMFPRTPGISTTSQRQRVAAALAFGQPGAPPQAQLAAQVAANRSGFVPSATHFADFGRDWSGAASASTVRPPTPTPTPSRLRAGLTQGAGGRRRRACTSRGPLTSSTRATWPSSSPRRRSVSGWSWAC